MRKFRVLSDDQLLEQKAKLCTFEVKFDQWKGAGCQEGLVPQNAPTMIAIMGLLMMLGVAVICLELASTGQLKSNRHPETDSRTCPTTEREIPGPPDWLEVCPALGCLDSNTLIMRAAVPDVAKPLSHGAAVASGTSREDGEKGGQGGRQDGGGRRRGARSDH